MPGLPASLKQRLAECAVALGRAARYDSLGTVEFLIDVQGLEAAGPDASDAFVFIEANPSVQVEHTITEQVLGVDGCGYAGLRIGTSFDPLLANDWPTRRIHWRC